jgi:uncharacterized protein involved in outer membrane biogenesis
MKLTAMRKIIVISAALVLVILAFAGILLLLVDVDQFRDPILAQLAKRLQRKVSASRLGLRIIPLSIRLENLAIDESPQFRSQTPFASAKDMYVSVSLFALLRKQVNVESIRLIEPQVELIRNAAGVWNFSSLGRNNGSGGESNLAIGELQIQNGRLAITDLQQRKPRTAYDHIDVDLRNYAPGKTFQLGAGIAVPGPAGAVANVKVQLEGRDAELDGRGTLDVTAKQLSDPAHADFKLQGNLDSGLMRISDATMKLGGLSASAAAEFRTKAEPPGVSAELKMDNAALADLLRLASALGASSGVSGSGTLSLTARVSGAMSDPVLDGSGSLRDARLNLPSLKKPLEIQTAVIRADKNSASFNDVSLSLGSMHARGSVAARDFAHPQLDFTASINKLDGAELQQIVASPDAKSSGRSTGASTLRGAGTLTVGTLVYDQIALADLRATCKLDNGVIRLDPLTAKGFGGQQTGSISIDTRQPQTAFDVKAKLVNVDANQLLSATTPVKRLFFGSLNGDINVQLRPSPRQDFARALNGTVQMQVTNGKLAGVQLLNEMVGLAKILGFAKRNETYTNILKLAGTLRIQDGLANTDDLRLDFDGGSLTGAGSLGLADQQLKMRLTTVLAKELSQGAGASKVAGLMSTVLANSRGELVVPALVSGTFDKPRFQPDPERIAKMRLEGLLPTRDNPGGTASKVQGILGALTGAKTENQPAKTAEPGAQAAPKKGIFDIIDSIRKKPEKK